MRNVAKNDGELKIEDLMPGYQAWPDLMTEKEVAEVMGKSRQTIANDRHLQRGLPYGKFGRHVRYFKGDVAKALIQQRIIPEEAAA